MREGERERERERREEKRREKRRREREDHTVAGLSGLQGASYLRAFAGRFVSFLFPFLLLFFLKKKKKNQLTSEADEGLEHLHVLIHVPGDRYGQSADRAGDKVHLATAGLALGFG